MFQLLDSCIKNCGRTFHLEIASREFETEFQRLMTKVSAPVAQKMRISLKKWAENEFKKDHQLNLIPSLYQKLRSEGGDFSDINIVESTKIQTNACKELSIVSQQEDEDLAKAIKESIELSLKEKNSNTVSKIILTLFNNFEYRVGISS